MKFCIREVNQIRKQNCPTLPWVNLQAKEATLHLCQSHDLSGPTDTYLVHAKLHGAKTVPTFTWFIHQGTRQN